MSFPFDPGMFKDLFETPFGRNLWAYLNEERTILQMETATTLRRPALEPLEETLVEKFDEEIRADRAKQLCGRMARQIMEREGYLYDRGGVPITNKILFSSAARYKKRG
ncbi:hypothetical protein [Cupriavidus sp. SK-3]|uniref:hypothetical protein n=1 Tax=Cupriavidus sp. SK-3 TaxID=1470558 RepID=UPI000A54C062|nr:hypothetical protein [Cupriavidus sp. SK-3]